MIDARLLLLAVNKLVAERSKPLPPGIYPSLFVTDEDLLVPRGTTKQVLRLLVPYDLGDGPAYNGFTIDEDDSVESVLVCLTADCFRDGESLEGKELVPGFKLSDLKEMTDEMTRNRERDASEYAQRALALGKTSDWLDNLDKQEANKKTMTDLRESFMKSINAGTPGPVNKILGADGKNRWIDQTTGEIIAGPPIPKGKN